MFIHINQYKYSLCFDWHILTVFLLDRLNTTCPSCFSFLHGHRSYNLPDTQNYLSDESLLLLMMTNIQSKGLGQNIEVISYPSHPVSSLTHHSIQINQLYFVASIVNKPFIIQHHVLIILQQYISIQYESTALLRFLKHICKAFHLQIR